VLGSLATAIGETGCARVARVCNSAKLAQLRDLAGDDTVSGERLHLSAPLSGEVLTTLAATVAAVYPNFVPVRAILFDKTSAHNWSVPWHQDRTIAVAHRCEVPGFGPWSVKRGVVHVEPPFELLAGMLTVRLHLDDCPANNAPLVVALGSHRERVRAVDAATVARRFDPLVCEAAAGDAWLYSTPILHRSDRQARDGRRRVVQIDFASAALPGGLQWAG